jgi:hypothetical protein
MGLGFDQPFQNHVAGSSTDKTANAVGRNVRNQDGTALPYYAGLHALSLGLTAISRGALMCEGGSGYDAANKHIDSHTG